MTYKYAKAGGFLLLGAFIASMLDTVVVIVIGIAALVIGILLKLFSRDDLRLFDLAVISVGIGFLLVGVELRMSYYPAKALDGHSAEIVGTVTEVTSDSGRSYYTVETESVGIEGAPQEITLHLGTWGDNYIPLYDRIRCKVHFFSLGDESFSELLEDRSRGISVYAYTESNVEVLGESKKGISYGISAVRGYLSEKLDSIYYGKTNAFMKRLLLGFRNSSLSNSVISSFRRAGMSHILVVSGMHLAIVIGIFERLLQVGKSDGIELTLKILFIMLVIVLYMAISGFGFSVMRAGFMLLLYYFAKLLRSRSAGIDNLGMAVIGVILVKPLSACNVGFLMSVMSTAAIIILSTRLRYVLFHSVETNGRTLRKFVKKVSAAFSVSLCAWLVVIPVAAFYYGEISLVAPISNIFAGYLAEIIISLGMLSLVISLIPAAMPFAKLIGAVAAFFENLLEKLADFFADLPFSEASTEQKWVTVFIIGAIVLFALPCILKKSMKYMKYSVIMSVMLLLLGILAEKLIFMNTMSTEITALKSGTAITCSKGGYSVIVTKGYSDGDSYRLRTSEADALFCMDSENEAVEIELCNKMKPKLALTDNEWVEYFGESTLMNGGKLELWDGGSVKRIGNAVELDTGEILVLYIFGKCDIMELEPRFRRADIMILDGITPESFPALRTRYMVLRDFGGYYSGAEELMVLREDSVSFCSKNKNIRKGWDFF